MIFWYFMEQNASFLEQVLPQWKPMKVSFCVYGVLPLMSLLYRSAGTVLLMSSSVTASTADAGADELGKRAVDVHFAGNRDAHAGEAAVDIARNKAELRLECRPALACNGDILAVAAVILYPVEQGQSHTVPASAESRASCCPCPALLPCLRRPSEYAGRPRAY